MLISTLKLIKMYRIANSNERLGQFFINRYINYSWPNLYYATNEEVAVQLIDEWMTRHNYIDTLPMPLKPLLSGTPPERM